MSKLDPRLNAYRADLAAAGLRGQVDARRFVEGEPAQVCRGVANLHRRPAIDAPVDTQLLFGEPVTLYERAGGWAWVQSRQDGYVGYVEAAQLGTVFAEPDHSVAVLRSHVFSKPDLKAPPLDALAMTSAVEVTGQEGRFSRIAFGPGGSGWIYSAHLAPAGSAVPDYTATALQFLGVPYLWGGKSSEGLDCSGLIQVAVARAGFACPRDTDMQAAGLGKEIAPGLEGGLARHRPAYGDILFMPGHVAIALDESRVVHANACHMLVTIEPLADLLARVAAECGRPAEQVVTSIRRPT